MCVCLQEGKENRKKNKSVTDRQKTISNMNKGGGLGES